MLKEYVDALLEGYIDGDNYVYEGLRIEIEIPPSRSIVITPGSDFKVEMYFNEDSIQINDKRSTMLLSYDAIKLITIN